MFKSNRPKVLPSSSPKQIYQIYRQDKTDRAHVLERGSLASDKSRYFRITFYNTAMFLQYRLITVLCNFFVIAQMMTSCV